MPSFTHYIYNEKMLENFRQKKVGELVYVGLETALLRHSSCPELDLQTKPALNVEIFLPLPPSAQFRQELYECFSLLLPLLANRYSPIFGRQAVVTLGDLLKARTSKHRSTNHHSAPAACCRQKANLLGA